MALEREQVENAQSVAQKTSTSHFYFLLYHYIGRVKRQEGDYSSAFENYFKALDLFEVYSPPLTYKDRVSLLQDIGWAYYLLKEFLLAEDYYEQAMASSLEKKDSLLYAKMLFNLGTVYQESNQIEKYLLTMNEAIGIYNRNGKQEAARHILGFIFPLNLGQEEKNELCMFDRSSLEEVLAKLEKKSTPNDPFYILALVHKAGCDLQSNDNDKALAIYDSMIQIIPEIEDPNFKTILVKRLLGMSKFIGDSTARHYFENEIKVASTAAPKIIPILKDELTRRIDNEDKLVNNQALLHKRYRRSIIIIVLLIILLITGYCYVVDRKGKLEQKLLQQQLNPHFLNNTLSLLQLGVIRGNTAEALTLTSLIGRLYQHIQSFSKKEEWLLSEELVFIQEYLQVNTLRFNHTFSYHIEIAPEIQEEKKPLFIPPMILQPVIENAFVHGKIHQQEKGHIAIKVKGYNTKMYSISIANAPTDININLDQQHEPSHSLALINKRLRLLGLPPMHINLLHNEYVVTFLFKR
ncbi:MAG: tetratricopeptide repeat protein [Saprospiraceae bacterium]